MILLSLAVVVGLSATAPVNAKTPARTAAASTALRSCGNCVVVDGKPYYEHRIGYLLQGHGWVLGKTVGPAHQTYYGKSTIVGFHKSGSAYVPVVHVVNVNPTVAAGGFNRDMGRTGAWSRWAVAGGSRRAGTTGAGTRAAAK